MTSSLGALILDFWSIGILFSSVSWNKALISQQKFVKAHLFCFDNILDNYSFCENCTKYWIRSSFVLHSLIQSFTENYSTNITNMEVFANCNEGVTEWIFKVYVSPSPEFQVSIESALLSTTLDLTPSFSSAASSSSLSLFWRRPPPASLGFTYQLVVQHSQTNFWATTSTLALYIASNSLNCCSNPSLGWTQNLNKILMYITATVLWC